MTLKIRARGGSGATDNSPDASARIGYFSKPIRLTMGGRSLEILLGDLCHVGVVDGEEVCRSPDKAAVARLLILAAQNRNRALRNHKSAPAGGVSYGPGGLSAILARQAVEDRHCTQTTSYAHAVMDSILAALAELAAEEEIRRVAPEGRK